ncbi:Potassium voltage-gated channel subfamily H member 5 (Ether-a-go-go potassium channel 2) (rEAG2) (Voltage-gated potassium channel subunit Kv10.2) [Durusdinium trenchii]|uniref:Potassium voltage-gated channel subfamily H member 5 (Ether-a-go-go potassium channel 2) (REAG2) (Voltage-gated potassium channel subunit Kv10.2) n=1 Tax=Durusdinium trenchii TaxID=1381693 RepID=A0ABP0KPT0_9DINO
MTSLFGFGRDDPSVYTAQFDRDPVEAVKALKSDFVDGAVYAQAERLNRYSYKNRHKEAKALLWDAIGLSLIMLDAFVLPVTLAWDLEEGWQSAGSIFLLFTFVASVAFWSTDLILNLTTAFYKNGKLVTERKEIVLHYAKTWLLFDISLLTLDFVNATTEVGELAALRYARMVRAFRLLRLLKMSKLQDILQEVAASSGRQGVMLIIAIVNTTFIILLFAHVLTCIWYALGKAAEESMGIESWLTQLNAYGPDFEAKVTNMGSNVVTMQYLTSLRYIMNELAELSEKCCKQNQFYQVLYPDPSKLFHNIAVGKNVRESLAREASRSRNQTISMGVSMEKLESAKSEVSQQILHLDQQSTKSDESGDVDPGLPELLSLVASKGLECTESLPKELERRVPELHSRHGTHIVFDQAAEQDRAMSACISILALVHNRYDMFTQPQAAPVKLRPDQWEELQKMVQVISPSLEQLHAVVILLSIRGLGKNKTVLSQVPKDMQRPERAVIHLMDDAQHVVPSVAWLSEAAKKYVHDALHVHETFNLAQMLQGENTPANVRELYQLVNEQGQSSFNFYMLFLLGFMSGIAGGEGSRFMNAKNAEGSIAGFCMLQKLLTSQPQEIYWGYMVARAKALYIPFETPEDLVLIRLACLCRLQDAKAHELLKVSWNSLGQFQKKVLTDHFLADGIETQAFVLEFLPMCFANAKTNGLIGLTLLLEVLVELLTNLKQAVQGLKEMQMMHAVDLMDMSEFIAAVQNRFVFQTCVSRCSFKFSGSRISVEMTGKNWGRTNDPDSDLTSLAYEVKSILANQKRDEQF